MSRIADPAVVDRIRVLAFEGHSLSHMARDIGISRNAVGGLIARNAIVVADHRVKRDRSNQSPHLKRQKRLEVAPSTAGTHSAWPNAERQCRWIHGDPRPEPHWCLKRTEIGESYCPSHRKRVWNKVERRS